MCYMQNKISESERISKMTFGQSTSPNTLQCVVSPIISWDLKAINWSCDEEDDVKPKLDVHIVSTQNRSVTFIRTQKSLRRKSNTCQNSHIVAWFCTSGSRYSSKCAISQSWGDFYELLYLRLFSQKRLTLRFRFRPPGSRPGQSESRYDSIAKGRAYFPKIRLINPLVSHKTRNFFFILKILLLKPR